MLVLTAVPVLPGKLASCVSGVPTWLSTSMCVVGVPASVFSSLASIPVCPTLLEASYGDPSCLSCSAVIGPTRPDEVSGQLLA